MLLRFLAIPACLAFAGCGGNNHPDPDTDPSPAPLPAAEMTIQRLDHASFRFAATNPGTQLSYHWDMGDGQMLQGHTVEYSFASTGAFDVTLTLSNPDGETASVSQQAHVRNSPPEARYGARFNQLDLVLDASMSFDVDGNIDEYAWLINGQSYAGPTVEVSLAQPGDLDIELVVTDSFGESSEILEDTLTVTGSHNTPPEPVIDVLLERNYIHLLGSNSIDPDGEYLTFQWFLSDGNHYEGDGIVHAFAEPGNYSITLQVTDGTATTETTRQITIETMDDVSKPYRKSLFEASLNALRRCGYCHRNRAPLLGEYGDLDKVDEELSTILLTRSALHLYSFPSEQNGRRHRGNIGGRDIDAGDVINDQLPVWHDLVSGMAEYYGLEANF